MPLSSTSCTSATVSRRMPRVCLSVWVVYHCIGLAQYLFERFPVADVYKARKATKKNDEPGTVRIFGPAPGRPGIINAFAQIKPGAPKAAKDRQADRLHYFEMCLGTVAGMPGMLLCYFCGLTVQTYKASPCHTRSAVDWVVGTGMTICRPLSDLRPGLEDVVICLLTSRLHLFVLFCTE
jgi:hypothetical protein